jgi:hypothetical protein
VDVGVAPWHQFAIVPDDAIDLVERNSHGLSPGLTLARPRRGAVGYAWALTYTSLAAGFHPHMSVDMLLW